MERTESRRRSAVANQSGFNLIEVLASITIVGIVAVGLTANTITSIKTNAFSRDALTATTLAQDRLEQIRAMDAAQVSLLRSAGDTSADGKFRRQWTVAPGPTLRLVQVTVRVSWDAPEPRSVQAVAYVCRAATC